MKQIKLQTKIILLSLIGSIILSTGSFFAFQNFANKYESRVLADLGNSVSDLADKIGAQFYERYGDVQAFAVNSDIRSLNNSKMVEVLNDYVRLYGIYDLIVVVDTNGQLVASNDKDPSGKTFDNRNLYSYNYSKEEWFKKVINKEFTEDKEKGFLGTYFESLKEDPILSILNKKQTTTSFSTQITNQKGEVIGVISNRVNNKWFENEIKEMSESMHSKKFGSVSILLLNKENLTISNADYTDKVEFKPIGENVSNFFNEKIEEKNKAFEDSKKGEANLVGSGEIQSPKWINSIGWKVVIFNEKEEVLKSITEAKTVFYSVASILTLLIIAGSFVIARSIGQSILSISQKLIDSSHTVNDSSSQMAEQSVQLSESATEQASALQETMSAIDEISAMVDKNAHSAEESKKASEESQSAVAMGKENVGQMIQSINELNENSSNLEAQLDKNNEKLEGIIKLIADIENKTKVINDIVFQTKLLSFNASVEAARAAEHGKGFAVVADEVRKLAEKSGESAKEISQALSSSISKVNEIINDSKKEMSYLMEESKEKVQKTISVANECQSSFDSIDQSFTYVSQLVSEIATASKEQAQGIGEVSKAVRQIEQGTQQISSVSNQSSSNAEKLRQESNQLNQVLNNLTIIVNGELSDNHLESKSFEKKPKSEVKVVRLDSRKELKKKDIDHDKPPKASSSGFGKE